MFNVINIINSLDQLDKLFSPILPKSNSYKNDKAGRRLVINIKLVTKTAV